MMVIVDEGITEHLCSKHLSLVLKALIFHLIIVKLVNTNFIQSLPKLLRKHAVMDLVCARGECHTS